MTHGQVACFKRHYYGSINLVMDPLVSWITGRCTMIPFPGIWLIYFYILGFTNMKVCKNKTKKKWNKYKPLRWESNQHGKDARLLRIDRPLLQPQRHREYVYSVAVYQKYLTRLGELIIFEPWRENYHFSQPS